MKKLYLLSLLLPLWALLPLWGQGGCLLAQSCVAVRQVSTNYATKQITFDLTWGTCNNSNHLYRVWVFADYQPVVGLTKGAWSRATITSSSVGTLHGNTGVWITGSQNATQRVTLTLNLSSAQFNWCAVATDYPPNATLSNGTYTLKGSPPFVINSSTTVSAKTYTGSITTITDATKNPEGFINIPTCTTHTVNLGTVGFTSNQTWIIGSQTWSAPVTTTYCNKTTYSSPTSAPIAIDCRNNYTAGYGHLFSWCMVVRYAAQLCPSPWRVPTIDDFCTLDKNLNNRSDCPNRTNATSLNQFFSKWGAVWNEVSNINGSKLTTNQSTYHAITQQLSATQHDCFVLNNTSVNPNQVNPSCKECCAMYYARELRCIRN